MNDAEIIIKIAEKKRQEAIDSGIDKKLDSLLFGDVQAINWSTSESYESKEWSKKLYELTSLKSLNKYVSGKENDELDCYEFIFENYTFLFKITKFKSPWYDSEDTGSYADLSVIYCGSKVGEFGLIRKSEDYVGWLSPEVLSIDSFIDGDWVNHLNIFLSTAISFTEWLKDRKKIEEQSIEASKLKKKFGITDKDISEQLNNDKLSEVIQVDTPIMIKEISQNPKNSSSILDITSESNKLVAIPTANTTTETIEIFKLIAVLVVFAYLIFIMLSA